MEVYVDKMIVKSKQMPNHIEDLQETFSSLKFYNMPLNPQKCIFGATLRKLLGYLVT